jgi:aldehyde dehydrogenase (NAD+)
MKVVAKRISRGKWSSNNGQACIAPDYVLVEESIRSQLVDKIKESLKQFYGEDPSKSPDLSRVVNASHWGRLMGLLNDESTADKVVHGGQSDKNSLYIAPTLMVDPPLDSPIMQEEIFGPILPIITVKNVDEAIKFVNSRPKPLALYLFTNDKKVQEQVLEETSSGGVTVNDTVIHVRHSGLPFGGVGDSGMGAYHGKHSFDTFSHKKAVLYQDLATGNSTSTYPPYNQVMNLTLCFDWGNSRCVCFPVN